MGVHTGVAMHPEDFDGLVTAWSAETIKNPNTYADLVNGTGVSYYHPWGEVNHQRNVVIGNIPIMKGQ